MISPDQVTAVLFAGGNSRRMGRDKAGLPWGDPPRPLWQFQLEKLEKLDLAEILISARPGRPFGSVAVVVDETPGAGPLPALAGCFRQARTPYLLPLAVDMPAMTTGFLAGLLEESGPSGLVYRDGSHFQPFPALYPAALLPVVTECLAAGRDSMQQFIRAAVEKNLLAATLLTESASALFKSLNSPADLPG